MSTLLVCVKIERVSAHRDFTRRNRDVREDEVDRVRRSRPTYRPIRQVGI